MRSTVSVYEAPHSLRGKGVGGLGNDPREARGRERPDRVLRAAVHGQVGQDLAHDGAALEAVAGEAARQRDLGMARVQADDEALAGRGR